MSSPKRCLTRLIYLTFLAILSFCLSLDAQQILGTITGTVKEPLAPPCPRLLCGRAM